MTSSLGMSLFLKTVIKYGEKHEFPTEAPVLGHMCLSYANVSYPTTSPRIKSGNAQGKK